jgi:hypothetical protein
LRRGGLPKQRQQLQRRLQGLYDQLPKKIRDQAELVQDLKKMQRDLTQEGAGSDEGQLGIRAAAEKEKLNDLIDEALGIFGPPWFLP